MLQRHAHIVTIFGRPLMWFQALNPPRVFVIRRSGSTDPARASLSFVLVTARRSARARRGLRLAEDGASES